MFSPTFSFMQSPSGDSSDPEILLGEEFGLDTLSPSGVSSELDLLESFFAVPAQPHEIAVPLSGSDPVMQQPQPQSPCVEAQFHTLPQPHKMLKAPVAEPSPEFSNCAASKKSKRTAHEESHDEIDPSRTWSLTHRVPDFFSSIELSMKTRLSPRMQLVPKNIYGTLKYRIFVEAPAELNSSIALMARVEMICADSGEIESRAFPTQQEIESAFRLIEGGKFQAEMYVSVDGKALSYQKSKTEYALQVSIFLASNRDVTLARYETPPFRVYARKPNQPPKKNKASSSKTVAKSSSSKSLKKPQKMAQMRSGLKQQPFSSSVDAFANDLEGLFSMMTREFDSLQKEKCQELVLRRLLSELY